MNQSANPTNIERLESTESDCVGTNDLTYANGADLENDEEINTDRMSNTSNHSEGKKN